MLRRNLSIFQNPSNLKSIWQIANSFVPYILLWIVAARLYSHSFWWALPVILLAAGFMVRIFIIFHDCGHQNFFRSKKANNFWGVITGVLTFTPYSYWSRKHARHHATSANLDQRGQGDVWMMTVQEFREASRMKRLEYRMYRNPFVMFFLGPLLITLIKHRFVGARASRRDKMSVYGTNLGILLIAVPVSLLIGLKAYLTIQFLVLFISHVVGVWLFYVQHQFEDVYWARDREWNFVEASLMGGSYYKLPAVLRWFTGNIGFHHVHHLNSRIPNYNLPRCQKQIPALSITKPTKLFESLKALKYRLWDEDSGKLVGYREARRLNAT